MDDLSESIRFNPWLLPCVICAITSIACWAVLLAKSRNYFGVHFFFVFFRATVVIYLQIAPLLALLSPDLPLVLAVWGFDHPIYFVREYAILQCASLLLFQVPMTLLYLSARFSPKGGYGFPTTNVRNAQLVGLASIGLAMLFLHLIS